MGDMADWTVENGAMGNDDSGDDWETPCQKREDGQHCNCWYDGKVCCACGDPAEPIDPLEPTGRPQEKT